MLDFLKKLLDQPAEARPEAHGPQEAVAALLVEVASSDADYDSQERAAIDRLLASLFGLAPDQAQAVRLAGERAQAEAADLVQFTRVAKTRLAPQERVALCWRRSGRSC
jgi:uncharacterized tellurite resistance protein B-like protein